MTKPRGLNFAERWMRDGLDVCRMPAQFITVETDMTQARALVQMSRTEGPRITYTHLLVRGAALALAANPDLHIMVCGNRVHQPPGIDIALSVAGETAVAPILVIEDAGKKTVACIAAEIIRRAPEAREADAAMMHALRQWGWLVPVGFLRRAFLRFLFRQASFRKRGAGAFQLSVLSDIDEAMSTVFGATALLVAGGVKERVVARNGIPQVRFTVRLTCCADHRVWDGRAAQRFLNSLRDILESQVLLDEAKVESSSCKREPAAVSFRAAHP